MRQRHVLRTFPLFATAAAGALAGHSISYALVFPGNRRRDAVLAASGHGYLPVAGRLAIVIALAGIGAVLLRSIDARARGVVSRQDLRPTGIAALILRLWLVQSAIFAAMEAGERLASAAPLPGMFRADLFLVGLGAQLLVAVVGALMLALLHRAAVGLSALTPPSVRPPRPLQRAAVPDVGSPLVGTVLAGPAAPRGPPPSL